MRIITIIPTTKINIPLIAYCPYSVAMAFRPVVVVLVLVFCTVCWSFSLGVVVNPGPCVVLAGVYGAPNKKFFICVMPHIVCIHEVLSIPQAEFVNCEIFSNHAGFLSYLSLMSCSHTPSSMTRMFKC